MTVKFKSGIWVLLALLWVTLFLKPGLAVAEVRSIHQWAVCDGVTDDSKNVASAFAAAADNAFTLQVDCPVYIHIGQNISRPIFIDGGTNVQFTTNGLFKTDNSLIPAFVIANSKNVHIDGWQIEYIGAESLVDYPGFYCEDRQPNKSYVTGSGCAPNEGYVSAEGPAPSSQFLAKYLAPWLKKNRHITYSSTGPDWHNPENISAQFYIIGDSSGLHFSNMRIFSPKEAGGHQFVPMIFTMLASAKDGQTVTRDMEAHPDPTAYAVPHGLTFSNIDIDGAYMSWQGTARDVTITHVRSHRYSTLQDAKGGNIGGPSKRRWFAPPHLFYFNFDQNLDILLHNDNIRISDVIDYGNRVGLAIDTPSNCCSGNSLSLKIGADNSSVDNYTSFRPDGFADILNSTNLVISNVRATYDSAFLNGLYPGIRFPLDHYHNVTLENVTLTDKAAATVAAPIYPPSSVDESQLTLKNVNVILNRWSGNPLDMPSYPYIHNIIPYYFKGNTDDISVNYSIAQDHENIVLSQSGNVGLQFWVATGPTSSSLHWNSARATACAASGGWSGTRPPKGSQTVSTSAATYVLTCTGQTGAGQPVSGSLTISADRGRQPLSP